MKPLLLRIAPTAEDLGVEKRAKKFLGILERRFPDDLAHLQKVTFKTVQLVKKTNQESLSRLEKLPVLSQEQVDADLAALPKEEAVR